MRAIPQSILDKINKQNQTLYENANPIMEVTVARAKTTVMDSTYWTVETIREKAGLGDVSLAPRRFTVRGRPNRIYEIHVDNGVVGTAIREYPDRLKDGWQNQFELGTGSKVGIAFNGHWERYRKLWRLVSDEKPHIMWVDEDNKLQTQHWDNVATKQELDANVVYVRALRGWKNVNFVDKDQGIIAGYIKTDGTVWYRNYCSQLDGTSTWENERQLIQFTGTAVSLNLFITNDYRMGFIIEDSLGKIFWYITERNWAGMAIAPEIVSVSPIEVSATLIDIEYPQMYASDEYIAVAPFEIVTALLFARTDNQVLESMNIPTTKINDLLEEYQDWGWTIEVKVENPIPELLLSKIVAIDIDKGTPIAMSSIAKVDDFTFRLNISDIVESGINNIDGDIRINISGVLNPAGYTYDDMEKIFTPINLVPTSIPLPEVEVIYNE